MPSKALKVKGVLPLAGGTQIEALKIELKKGFADVAGGEPDFSTRCYLGAFGNAFTTVFSTLGALGPYRPSSARARVGMLLWFHVANSGDGCVCVARAGTRALYRIVTAAIMLRGWHAAHKE